MQTLDQNEELVNALYEAREQITALKEEVDKLCAPPSTYGVYRHHPLSAPVSPGPVSVTGTVRSNWRRLGRGVIVRAVSDPAEAPVLSLELCGLNNNCFLGGRGSPPDVIAVDVAPLQDLVGSRGMVTVMGHHETEADAHVVDAIHLFRGDAEFSLIIGTSGSSGSSSRAPQATTGSAYLSDGWIRNRSGDPVTVDLFYTPSDVDGENGTGVRKNTIVLPGYTTYRLADLVSLLFDTTGTGRVELRSTQLPQLSVRASLGTIRFEDGKLSVRFDAPQKSVTPGQVLVLYDGDEVLGGGWIECASV